MSEEKLGCGRPTGGPVGGSPGEQEQISATADDEKETAMRVMVGKKAPDFVAPAYVSGAFKNVKLSDYLGRWMVLCFYPGDFTFV